MPSFMFLDLVFTVPPLIDKEKRKQKKNKKTLTPVQMLVSHFCYEFKVE